MERTTKTQLEAMANDVNKALDRLGSDKRVELQGRNGYTGIDQTNTAYMNPANKQFGCVERTLFCGTKSEYYNYLHAMEHALYLADSAEGNRKAA